MTGRSTDSLLLGRPKHDHFYKVGPITRHYVPALAALIGTAAVEGELACKMWLFSCKYEGLPFGHCLLVSGACLELFACSWKLSRIKTEGSSLQAFGILGSVPNLQKLASSSAQGGTLQ